MGGTAGATLVPGDTVTYRTTITGTAGNNAFMAVLRDVPPAGFVYQEANLVSNYGHLLDVTETPAGVEFRCKEPPASPKPPTERKCFISNGVTHFKYKSTTNFYFDVTYKVPDNARGGIFESSVEIVMYNTPEVWEMGGVFVEVIAPDAATTTTLTAPATGTTGVAVDLTATIDPADAEGTVQFMDGADAIGAPVAVTGGVATLSHAFAAAGPHAVSAVFTPAAGFTGSTSAASTVEVSDPAPVEVGTTLALDAVGPVTAGDTKALTATVTPAEATGAVQFAVDGIAVGAPVPVDNGVATTNHQFAAAGTSTVKADFTGTGVYQNSTASQPVQVDAATVDTTTTLTVPATATTGVGTTLTATLDPTDAAGTVQFADGGVDIGEPVTVTGGVAALTHTFTAAGPHNITAVFTPAEGFHGSSASAQTVEVSDPAPTEVATTTVIEALDAVTLGQERTLKATVDPGHATGAVQFKVNGVAVGGPVAVVDGVATALHTFATAGEHTVTAEFVGTGVHLDSAAEPHKVTVPEAPGGGGGGAGGTGSLGSLGSLFGS